MGSESEKFAPQVASMCSIILSANATDDEKAMAVHTLLDVFSPSELVELSPPPAPAEPVESIEQERWAYKGQNGWFINNPDPPEPTSHDARFAIKQCVVVRSKAADDAMRERLHALEVALERYQAQVSSLTRERDELADELRHRLTPEWCASASARIADLERQVGEANERATASEAPSPPPAAGDEAWMERVINEVYFGSGDWKQDLRDALRRHAPRERYPEVADFLDAMDGKWWLASQSTSAPKDRTVCVSVLGENHFGPTIAAACRAALATVNEEASDGT